MQTPQQAIVPRRKGQRICNKRRAQPQAGLGASKSSRTHPARNKRPQQVFRPRSAERLWNWIWVCGEEPMAGYSPRILFLHRFVVSAWSCPAFWSCNALIVGLRQLQPTSFLHCYAGVIPRLFSAVSCAHGMETFKNCWFNKITHRWPKSENLIWKWC